MRLFLWWFHQYLCLNQYVNLLSNLQLVGQMHHHAWGKSTLYQVARHLSIDALHQLAKLHLTWLLKINPKPKMLTIEHCFSSIYLTELFLIPYQISDRIHEHDIWWGQRVHHAFQLLYRPITVTLHPDLE